MPRIFITGTIRGTGADAYATGSGYLNLPPRVTIRQRDNATGSYLTISRTTGFKIDDPTDPFDDTRAIDFGSGSNVKYPTILKSRDDNRFFRNWIATPNQSASFYEEPIYVSGIVRPGLSDQGLKRSIHQSSGSIPFDDSRIYLEDNSFYLTGTSHNIIPGFSSRLADKIQIKIDMPNSSDAIMSRFDYRAMSNEPAGDETSSTPGGDTFVSSSYTGMRYYNFATNVWDQIGLTDPGTGDSYDTTMWTPVHGDVPVWSPYVDNTPNAPIARRVKTYQFAMSPQLGMYPQSIDGLLKKGYSGIGTPTMSGFAPFSGSYHATASQLLDMSGYIRHPFLLEKAVLEIPVIARRRHGKMKAGASVTDDKPSGANRDIDNYVFFMYRQRNPAVFQKNVIDTPAYASGSTRFLIMSASLAFYNSQVFTSGVIGGLSGGLPHTPAFSHDFNVDVSGSNAANVIHAFTGSLRVEMIPAVPNAYRSGGSRFPAKFRGNLGQNDAPTIVIQDYWAGGTTFKDPDPEFGTLTSPKSGYMRAGHHNSSAEVICGVKWGNTLCGSWSTWTNLSSSKPPYIPVSEDTRPVRGFSGLGHLSPTFMSTYFPTKASNPTDLTYALGISRSSKGSASSLKSPYLLLPGDKLVIGCDAGVSMLPASGASDNFFPKGHPDNFDGYDSYLNISGIMSGSFMKIRQGSASLTLYGSLITQGKERLFELNQNLTSDALHESVHFDNPVVDQYLIDSKFTYSGSYIDNLIFGDINRDDGLTAHPPNAGIKVPASITRGVYSSLGSGTERVADFYGTATSVLSIVRDQDGLARWNTALLSHCPRDSLLRASKMFDKSERYYDTIMPDLIDFADRCGMTIDTSNPQRRLITATLNGQINEAVISAGIGAGVNKKAYPYVNDPPRLIFDDVVMKFTNDPDGRGIDGGAHSVTYTTKNDCISTGLNEIAVLSLLFKQGTRLQCRGGETKAYSTQVFNFYPAYSSGSASGREYDIPYGAQSFLYGIQNVRPLHSNAIFRYDRYGQFRDMLEQRKDGRLWNSENSLVSDGVVENIFVKSADGVSIVSPYQTDASNMSHWSTSSMPYLDGVARNRGEGEDLGFVTMEAATFAADATLEHTLIPLIL